MNKTGKKTFKAKNIFKVEMELANIYRRLESLLKILNI